MTEKQVKEICKWAVEHGNRPFSKEEKEFLKQAIDESETVEDLIAVAIAALTK